MKIDSDHAVVTGVVIGQLAGVLGVHFGWPTARWPSLELFVAIAAASIVGALIFGFIAHRLTRPWH
jgi:hypothetical protein